MSSFIPSTAFGFTPQTSCASVIISLFSALHSLHRTLHRALDSKLAVAEELAREQAVHGNCYAGVLSCSRKL